MLPLSFKQTNSEFMVRAAASILFGELQRRGLRLVAVSDLSERPQYGFTASARLEPSGPKFVRITDLQDGKIDWNSVPYCACEAPDNYRLSNNDILFARTGATTGKTYLVRDPQFAVFASYLIRLRPKPNVISGYLHSFFQSENYWAQVSEGKEGSAQPNVNGEKLAALKIPYVEAHLQKAVAEFIACVRRRQDGDQVELPELPQPLTEQRRVVARIEELAAKINEACSLKREAEIGAEALSYSMLRSTRQRLLLSSYPRTRLGSLTKVTSGGTPSRDNLSFWNGDIPWVKTGELMDGDISQSEEYITQAGMENSSAKVFPPETVLIALYGQGQTRGRTGRLLISAATNQACCAILPQPQNFEARYIQFWLRSLYIELRENTQGGAQPNWNGALIKALEVVIPPLPEQRRIVAYFDELQKKTDALKALQEETSAELDALMPSILDRAFHGEL
jgi:type I restriction enzyme, S subunit